VIRSAEVVEWGRLVMGNAVGMARSQGSGHRRHGLFASFSCRPRLGHWGMVAARMAARVGLRHRLWDRGCEHDTPTDVANPQRRGRRRGE